VIAEHGLFFHNLSNSPGPDQGFSRLYVPFSTSSYLLLGSSSLGHDTPPIRGDVILNYYTVSALCCQGYIQSIRFEIIVTPGLLADFCILSGERRLIRMG